ncbi:MAG: hypothetical protein ABI999_06460 [Acidobacteriota bacterium]
MKKIFATLMMVAMMAISIPFLSTNASAQTRRYYRSQSTYTTPYNGNRYDSRSTYQKHRNLINIGIGTGAGALIGALIGGGKGALIGGAIGAGGSALYTYKLNPKTHRYYRAYNR